VSVACFKERMNVRRLPLNERLYMRIVTALTNKEQEGEFLNPSSMRSWAAGLYRSLGLKHPAHRLTRPQIST